MRLETGAAPYVPYVFSHLWDRGVEELAGLGLTPEQAAEKALDFCLRDKSYALVADNPVCVFGLCQGTTWFQATDEFLTHHVAITKALREMSAGRDCVIYSQCVHPRTEAWFRRIGFVRDGWEGQTVTGKPLYRFRRV